MEEENENEQTKDENEVEIGTHVYLIEEKVYAFVKKEIDENLYECVVKISKSDSDSRMLMLYRLDE